MFQNNIKITLSNFRKHRLYGAINIIGLTLGLTAALPIILYIQHELSFDQFLENKDHLYQVTLSSSYVGESFTTAITQQHTKEIGIRKVLGASVTGIVTLLSKDFITLVGISFIIATPIAYYFMNQWLQDFAYRIELQWWVFALAGVAAIGIALLTVSIQSVRTALANPVESLKSE